MDNETFQLNISLEKTDTHYLSIVKTRLWSFQLMSINLLIHIKISSSTNFQNGLGLMVINALATSTEGCITDFIAEHLFINDTERIDGLKKLNLIGWQRKKKKYNELFQKKLESYKSFESIEYLFLLRNNISHGETHLEVSRREITSGNSSKIESVGTSFQKVRKFLVQKHIIQETDVSSNAKVLWTMDVARYFNREVHQFLAAVIKGNESPNKLGIEAEFNTVISNQH